MEIDPQAEGLNLRGKYDVLKDSAAEEKITGLTEILQNLSDIDAEAVSDQIPVVVEIADELSSLLALNAPEKLPVFMETLENVFTNVSNAKTSKVMTTVLKKLSQPGSAWGLEVAVQACTSTIERCKEKNKKFLRHRVEQNLSEVYYHQREYKLALSTVQSLLFEIKRLDDKLLLVELHLHESKVLHALRNITKAKAALTAARASASSVYVNPDLQADMDLQGGVIATEEGDYKTGSSYFFEAFEGCRIQKDKIRAKKALVYMLLNKVMARKFKELNSIVSSKAALEYICEEVTKMHEISKACAKRDVKELEKVIITYPTGDDTLLKAKLKELAGTLQEENLLKLLEPYSKVQISHIASLIDLPVDIVTRKLSHMILDKKLHGILDQGAGAVIMYDNIQEDQTYEYAIQTLEALEEVVDQLLDRARRS